MTSQGITLIVSGLKAEAPETWSSVADQAIWREEAPGGLDAGRLTQITEAGMSQAAWVHLNIDQDDSLFCAARLDIVLWAAGGELPGDEDIGRLLDEVTELVDPMKAVHADWSLESLMGSLDPWTAELARDGCRWPGGWQRIERSDHLAITCTRRALPAVRLWFVASTSGYVDVHGRRSLSGLLETDDAVATRGALAGYVGRLAVERQDRMAGMLLSKAADLTDDVVTHGVQVAKLRETETNINIAGVNVCAAAARLAASLGPRASEDWTFLRGDDRDIEISLATARGNAERQSAVQARLQVMQQHRDAVAQGRDTRANTYATLLLAVAAGAFAGAALASQRRAAASIAFGGTLFVVGLLVVDAARSYRRIHGALALAVMAGAGAAGAAAFGSSKLVTALAAVIGAAVGFALFYVAWDWQRSRDRPGRLLGWLIAIPRPSSEDRRRRSSKAPGSS
jgi:hypothetical protein